MIMGEMLTINEYEKASDITESDIKAIAEDWELTASDKFKNLLNAEVD